MSPRLFVALVGAAGMGAQIAWARASAVALGGTFAAGALTLAGAMAGLSIGAAWGGRRPSPRPFGFAAAAAAALVTPLLAALAALEGRPVLRTVLTAVLLTAAHVPFGAAIPAAARRRNAPHDADLYAAGAAGSAAGALAMGGLIHVICPVDVAGLILAGLLLSATAVFRPGPPGDRVTSGTAPALPLREPALAFALGFLGLAAELAWTRALGFEWESSPITFAWVASAHVAGLAAGAAVAGRLPLPRLLAAAAFLLAAAAVAVSEAGAVRTGSGRLAMALALVGLPAAAAGAAFARLLARAKATSTLLAANAAGSALGPLALWALAGVLPWAPRLLASLAVAYALLAVLTAPAGFFRLAPLGAAAALFLVPAVPTVGRFGVDPAAVGRDLEAVVLPFVEADAAHTVCVSRDTRLGIEHLWIDRSHQGDTTVLGRRIPRRLGSLPVRVLGRPPERTAVVGLGLGLTLAGLVEAGAGRVDVAELSAGVIRANRGVLADVNGRVLERDGVRVLHADGRTMLADASEPYDLVVVDMVYPSAAGAGALFSREFYALARRRLTADGLFVHWLPCSQLSPEDLAGVAAAFRGSFPDGRLLAGHLSPDRLILGLAGGARSGTADAEVLLDSAGLAGLAGEAGPRRDADARMEYRSARPRGFGARTLEEVISRLGPDGPWRLRAEAALAESLGEKQRAMDLYSAADRRFPGATDAREELRRIAYEACLAGAREASMRQDEGAMLRSLRTAAAYGTEGRIALGDALAARGLFREALGEFEKAAGASPRSADACLKAALAAAYGGDFPSARRHLDVALVLRPDRPPLLVSLDERLRTGGDATSSSRPQP